MPESNKKFDKQNRSDFSENLDQFNPDDSNFIAPIDLLQTLTIPVEIRITVLERITIFSMIDHDDIESLESYLNSPEVDLTVKDSIGETPLHAAVENNNYQIVQLLLEHGANANSRDFEENTPLHQASINKHYSIVQLLLRYNANVNSQNKDGATPLICSLFNKSSIHITQLLISSGTNINSQDKNGETAIFIAIRLGLIEIVNLFLEKGANLNVRNKNGKTPLDYSIKYEQHEIEELLKQQIN